jgi:hypothetical protein
MYYICTFLAVKKIKRLINLGHILATDLKDDSDIERERRALSIRANMIARRFVCCTTEVKLILFKAYCTTFYTCSLWLKYNKKTIEALRIQYNNTFRVLMGLPRYCSASNMFATANVDCFHTTMRKRAASLMRRVQGSANSILKSISERYECPYINHCWEMHAPCRDFIY